MGILLRKMNVVKEVDTEEKAKSLEEHGFKRILEDKKAPVASEKKPTSGKTPPKKSASAKEVKVPAKEGDEKDDSGSTGEDGSRSDGQPENG